MKSGIVTILGRPNVGKSTLVNYIVQKKISITTPKPQTTRFRILGVRNLNEAQIVFVDTPGFHIARNALNKYMITLALKSIEGADLIYLMVEVNDYIGDEYSTLFKYLEKASIETFLVINKIDLYTTEEITKTEDEFTKAFPFKEVFKISALTGKNVDDLVKKTVEHLKEGMPLFPEGEVTNIPFSLQVAELIREKLYLFLKQELPYETSVVVEEVLERKDSLIYIKAIIYVAKNSQKAIVIGANGSMIKKIGTATRLELQEILKKEVFLDIQVKVEEDWPKLENKLKRLGYIVE
ncbi:MAG: GTPase Era [Caldisericaceae bacterium]